MGIKNNKHAPRINLEFQESCDECAKMKKEEIELEAYRKVMKSDVQEMITEQLGILEDQTETIRTLHRDNIPIPYKKSNIHFAPYAGVIALFTHLIAFIIYLIHKYL